eukprot:755467-Hanusia_phi.AAC.4
MIRSAGRLSSGLGRHAHSLEQQVERAHALMCCAQGGCRRGDVEEHAILLCNLLLVRAALSERREGGGGEEGRRGLEDDHEQGFRFEAYCVIGTTLAGDPHMWVATLER